MTVELIQGLLLAFALVVILMPPYIRLLRPFGFGKQIREEGPQSHIVKEGTPTMGGLLIIVVVIGVSSFLLPAGRRDLRAAGGARQRRPAGRGRRLPEREDRRGDHGRARSSSGRRVVAIVAAWQIQTTYEITGIARPVRRRVDIDPWSTSPSPRSRSSPRRNGVNITDGLDGLSGGTLAFAFVAFMIIALLNVPAQPNLALLCALIIGALLGFLWFNVHPAQIFMATRARWRSARRSRSSRSSPARSWSCR